MQEGCQSVYLCFSACRSVSVKGPFNGVRRHFCVSLPGQWQLHNTITKLAVYIKDLMSPTHRHLSTEKSREGYCRWKMFKSRLKLLYFIAQLKKQGLLNVTMIYSLEKYLELSVACYGEAPFLSNSPDMSLNWRKVTWLKTTQTWKKKQTKKKCSVKNIMTVLLWGPWVFPTGVA